MLFSILSVKIPLCPAVSLLGRRMDVIKCEVTQRLIALAFLSAKASIFPYVPIHKYNGFCFENWLKGFAASALQELDSGLDAPWAPNKRILKKGHFD